MTLIGMGVYHGCRMLAYYRPVKYIPHAMDDKDRVDALLRLADVSWRAFDRRSSYEWKVSLALWSSLGLFAGAMLGGGVRVPLSHCARVGVTLGGVILWIAFVFTWTPQLYRRNQRDKVIADLIYFRVEDELGISGTQRRLATNETHWFNWSHGFQILVTTLLMSLAIFSIYVK
jgi:hypothetical protein